MPEDKREIVCSFEHVDPTILRREKPGCGENLLRAAKTIAVVGLSSRRTRPSYGVSEYMQSQGYRIVPVNPNEQEILGQKAYATLEEIPVPIDIVDIFRRPDAVMDVVDSAIRIGAKAVWMQEGVVNEEAAAKARAAGLGVVMDRCILKEHRRMMMRA